MNINIGDRVRIAGLRGTHRVLAFSRHVPGAVTIQRHGHRVQVLISELSLAPHR